MPGEKRPQFGRRYRLIRKVGEGSFGRVYRVRDRLLGRDVALKAFKPGTSGVDVREMLRQEFLVLSRMRHPGVPEVHDVAVDRPDPFFTMEYLRGPDILGRFSDPSPGGNGDRIADIIAAFLSILSALRYLHARGIIHGDLKPSNVLYRHKEDGEDGNDAGHGLVLVDFGLHLRAGRQHGISGTLNYLAPEQIRDGKLSAQTDLFSLGVLFYELLAGRNPFAGIDPLERAAGQIGHPPALGDHVPGVDRGLEDVTLRLLAPDVSLRYRDAEEAQRDLLLAGGWTESRAAAFLRRDFVFDSGWVGREGTLGELRRASQAVRESGRGRTVLLATAPGLGEERLRKQIGAETLAAGGYALTTSARGLSASDLVAELIGRLGAGSMDRGREQTEARQQLEMALEGLGGGSSGESSGDEWSKKKRVFFERVLRWLQVTVQAWVDAAPEPRPFVWTVQDLDLAEGLVPELLESVARRTGSMPLFLVLIGRRDHPWLQRFPEAAVLDLEPLKIAEVRELLRSNLPGIAGQAELARILHDQTQGNLRALERQVEELVRQGVVTWSSGGWSADPARVAEIDLTADPEDPFGDRLEDRSDEDRSLLSVAAALGDTFDLELLAATAGLAEPEALARMQPLALAGLVDREPVPDGGVRFRFSAPGLADRCAALVPAPTHRAHRKAALDQLERRIDAGAGGLRRRAGELCEELRRSREASVHHAALGRELREENDLEGAFRAFRRAEKLRRRAKDPVSIPLLADLVDAALTLGNHEEALPYARLLRRSDPDPDAATRSRNQMWVAIAEHRTGHRNAVRSLEEVLALPEAPGTEPERIDAGSRLAQMAAAAGDFDRAAMLHRKTVARAGELPSKQHLVRALLRQGDFWFLQGNAAEAEACYQRCHRLGEEEAPSLLPTIHLGLGQVLLDPSPARAVEEFETAADLAREYADIMVEGWAHYNAGIGHADLADTGRAREHYELARSAFGGGSGWELARTEAQLGNLARNLGEFRRAEEHYARFRSLASAMPAESPSHRIHRLNRWLLRDQQGETDLLQEIRDAEPEFPPDHPRSHLLYLLVRSRLELGQELWAEARSHAQSLLTRSRENRNAHFEASALMLLGTVAAREGRSGEARVHLHESNRVARTLGNEVLRADVDLCRAEVAAEYPDLGDDPRPLLDRAEEVFRRGGLRPRLEQAHKLSRTLAAATGSRPNQPVRPVKELETMYRASEILRSSHDLTDLLEKLLDSAVELMRAERGLIFLQEGPKRLELKASRGADRDTARDAGEISRGILERAIQDAKPIYSTNAMTDERFRSNRSVANFQIRSFLCVPLLLPDRAIGTLYVDNRKLDSVFDESDARFLMAYGGLAAAAIENGRHENLLRQNVQRLAVEVRESWHPGQIVGNSPEMRRVLDLARKAGPREATVLIRGESGTGKELIARMLHDLSPRRQRAFVAVNCAALPGPLVESELFGIVRGAATDVVERAGKFEEAQGGTIFLDEIGDLALEAQAKILRAIQERRIERVGSHRTVALDIRLVAATHSDLEAAILDGRFREDLYYRLNVVPITLPPLRERPEDIAALVRHYVDRFCAMQNKPNLGIQEEVLGTYVEYEWPGNVRELKNAVERGVLLSDGEWLLPFERPLPGGRDLVTNLDEAFARGLSERDLKRIYANYVFERLRGSKSRACELLNIDFKTLRSRLN